MAKWNGAQRNTLRQTSDCLSRPARPVLSLLPNQALPGIRVVPVESLGLVCAITILQFARFAHEDWPSVSSALFTCPATGIVGNELGLESTSILLFAPGRKIDALHCGHSLASNTFPRIRVVLVQCSGFVGTAPILQFAGLADEDRPTVSGTLFTCPAAGIVSDELCFEGIAVRFLAPGAEINAAESDILIGRGLRGLGGSDQYSGCADQLSKFREHLSSPEFVVASFQ